MKTVIVVSPNYLRAVFENVKKFSFHLQGYGNFSEACKALLKMNACDVLGMAYLSEKLPVSGSAEYEEMCKFLHKCDLLEESKKMIFICDSASALSQVVKKLTTLRVTHVPLEGMVTDTLINKELFGNLLLDSCTPYQTKKSEESKQYSVDEKFLLSYTPSISQYALRCLEPIKLLQTVAITLENDKVYQEYVSSGENTLLALLRKKKIIESYGKHDKRTDELIQVMLNDLTDDTSWCIYRSLLSMEVENVKVQL